MRFETNAKAKTYMKKKAGVHNAGGLKIFVLKNKRAKYKYVVCTYLSWLNGFYGGVSK